MALPSDGAAATVKQGSQAPLLCWLHASYGALWETLRENEEEKWRLNFKCRTGENPLLCPLEDLQAHIVTVLVVILLLPYELISSQNSQLWRGGVFVML